MRGKGTRKRTRNTAPTSKAGLKSTGAKNSKKQRTSQTQTEAERAQVEHVDLSSGDIGENADVWMIGDSIIHWAGERAKQRGRENLRLPGDRTVRWLTIRGMKWQDFHHVIQRERLFCTPPKAIVLHLGGNDLRTWSLYKLRRVINKEIKYLYECFPDTIVIWYDILQRRNWGGCYKENVAMEKKRRRVNYFGRKAVTARSQGRTLETQIDFATAGFYRGDGIHLSEVGLEMFLDSLRDGLINYMG
ncbi:uncharacterized protein LOC123546100 [Mercenaria mercenaria]|uniref:uncharacterized protein LOC123546100 n=1 Tax=Mercenaria mercenaria TaxID=6596 RepID=UPI00234EEE7B|nr:uncharacterized protein LOC123546100 [Mercenaria mercenaria]